MLRNDEEKQRNLIQTANGLSRNKKAGDLLTEAKKKSKDKQTQNKKQNQKNINQGAVSVPDLWKRQTARM